jgi:hypothetical protein
MTGPRIPANAVRAALPVVTIVTAVVAGVWLGVEIALLVVAAGAFAGVVALLWASVQALTGESPLTLDEALTLGAPSVEEEQKRAVLRALKDLDFERSVGKIGEDDYAELSARYRAEAKRLIQLIDAGSEAERERAEKALKARLERPAVKPREEAASTPVEAEDEAPAEPEAKAEAKTAGASETPSAASLPTAGDEEAT